MAASPSPPAQRRRRAAGRAVGVAESARPTTLFATLLLAGALLLSCLCPTSAQATLESQIAALQTDAGRQYLATLAPETIVSLTAGVEKMSAERRAALAVMPLDAVQRVFSAAKTTLAMPVAAVAGPAPAVPAVAAAAATAPAAVGGGAGGGGGGRAAALMALQAKGLPNEDGSLDEPSLRTLRALASLPEARLRELAALPLATRAGALVWFADGVGATCPPGKNAGAGAP